LWIENLNQADELKIHAAAKLLQANFTDSWQTEHEAIEEIRDLLIGKNICMVMIIDNQVMGLVGGMPQYGGNVFELHPLVIDQAYQGKGYGKQLVLAFEAVVQNKGGLTVYLGSDDEDNLTTLGEVDLYHNLGQQIKQIRNLKRHPYEFYQKCGYQIVGVLPDANGMGKPDIFMAKRMINKQ
jgi:aminoglycoside 6'-N-acetyltransferase I